MRVPRAGIERGGELGTGCGQHGSWPKCKSDQCLGCGQLELVSQENKRASGLWRPMCCIPGPLLTPHTRPGRLQGMGFCNANPVCNAVGMRNGDLVLHVRSGASYTVATREESVVGRRHDGHRCTWWTVETKSHAEVWRCNLTPGLICRGEELLRCDTAEPRHAPEVSILDSFPYFTASQ